MSDIKPSGGLPTPVRDHKSVTEYRLSISSNPGSRRSSFGANNNEGHETENMVNTYVLPQIQELADAMITLDSNFTQMNFIHENLVDLNESIGALLYGLMCNSWCVDFSHMPHDTAGEIRIMQELTDLESEKQIILRQLAESDDLKTRQENVHQKSPAKLARRSVKQPTSLSLFADQDLNDEDNTDASFVSNPSMVPPSNLKLRRKSILHTIRNNAISHDVFDQQRRRSLAVSASRLVPPNKRSTLGGIAKRNTIQSTSRRVTDRQILNKRPPF